MAQKFNVDKVNTIKIKFFIKNTHVINSWEVKHYMNDENYSIENVKKDLDKWIADNFSAQYEIEYGYDETIEQKFRYPYGIQNEYNTPFPVFNIKNKKSFEEFIKQVVNSFIFEITYGKESILSKMNNFFENNDNCIDPEREFIENHYIRNLLLKDKNFKRSFNFTDIEKKIINKYNKNILAILKDIISINKKLKSEMFKYDRIR
jgi:hypothetical protein